MALNPALDQHGLPIPFIGEVILLMRKGIELHVSNIPGMDRKWVAKGVLYLSTVRMVFVAHPPPRPAPGHPPLAAFDMPLLFVQGEKFNQPIFGCNNVSGRVFPVQVAGRPAEPQPPHEFVIYFMEGGVGTFLPGFSTLLQGLRAANPAFAAMSRERTAGREESQGGSAPSPTADVDPLPVEPPATCIDNVRSAYMDPNDPTVVYVEQPASFGAQVRRRRGYRTSEADG